MTNFAVENSPVASPPARGAVWVVDDSDDTPDPDRPVIRERGSETTPLGGEPSAVAVGRGAVWVANAEQQHGRQDRS